MEIIAHRRNQINQLLETPTKYGVEVDIRSNQDKLVVSHDPFSNYVDFEEWISFYKHGTLILNIKEEGLENKLLDLMSKFSINNFFFLDQSFPFLIKTIKKGEKRTAVRFSEYESIETVLQMKGLLNWVWIDFFTRLPLNKTNYLELKSSNFKICLVSPELQGFGKKECKELKDYILKNNFEIDAICTKKYSFWNE
ncbi:hypothetical protein HA152_07470 [Prochlorococcus marinus XMU1412]|uniref:phosphatidylinositol-specific phospholipase C/glycerophosphodiester phosphodiesterase family protein n=1 Tax=Prochlorococcus marinus TaxID=1219 RepID=UPI001ADB9C00|nr:phosphatidylinositol-specific phospholipase C/glycerophosphodiester phosphodiesterase family protein [Prochlorococcus marinus]MBO8240541.1 hypothetical protein [Prochlorococcus marinus XMU1412]MBW3071776.1 hypothetical protein [Prochlorococcus marinus str. MU1412]